MSASATRRPLRVTFLSWRDLAHAQAGGSEVLIDRLALGCMERGHDVTLMCGGPVGRRPYRVHSLGGRFAQYLRAPFAYARHSRDADVVVDVENGVPFFSRFGVVRRCFASCTTCTARSGACTSTGSSRKSAGRWSAGRCPWPTDARRLFAVSPSTADSLRAIGVPANSINVMINGIDLAPTASPRRGEEPVFVALGRLVAHKRLDLLLRAWDRVHPRIGGRLIIAGDGPQYERLRAMAGAGAEVVGAVSEEEKQRLMSSAWLLVHPALHEGWGIVVMEAAAHATPTLAFNVPGVRDAVQPDVTGVLVEDEQAFVDRWLELAGDPARREELGRGARERARGFSWSHTIDCFDALLREAAQRA